MTRRWMFLGTLLAGSVWYSAHGQELDPLPDPILTPGAVASTDVAEVCAWTGGMSYSQRHRQTTWEMKQAVLRAYNVPRPFRGEIDHRIPLCAGGADVAANLWPQTDFKAKDAMEAAVLSGRLPRHPVSRGGAGNLSRRLAPASGYHRRPQIDGRSRTRRKNQRPRVPLRNHPRG